MRVRLGQAVGAGDREVECLGSGAGVLGLVAEIWKKLVVLGCARAAWLLDVGVLVCLWAGTAGGVIDVWSCACVFYYVNLLVLCWWKVIQLEGCECCTGGSGAVK
jgi:hypothetical protein